MLRQVATGEVKGVELVLTISLAMSIAYASDDESTQFTTSGDKAVPENLRRIEQITYIETRHILFIHVHFVR
jgi:hypothetical protein